MEVLNIKNSKKYTPVGTSLMGYLRADINDIIKVLGEPDSEPSGDSKVDWEWIYKLDNEVVTIYNYKDGPSYLKNPNITIDKIEDWHIGGNSRRAVDLVRDLFEENNIKSVVYAN